MKSNLTKRVIVALFGIPVILFLAIAGKGPFLFFALFIGITSFAEFAGMLKRRKYYPNVILGSIAIIALIFNAYFYFVEFEILAFLIVAVALMWEMFRNKESAVANIGATLTGIFYIGMFSSALVAIREFYSDSFFLYDNGGYLIIGILASIWVCDSAAYFIGTALGKHKIFPRISPNKSWEGSIAGLVFAVATMVVFKFLLLDVLTLKDGVIIGLIIGVFGQIGDFAESMLKRDSGVKDSSSVIPGHGGIFDRFDSLIYSAPLVYIYLYYWTTF
ncbi:phosphatidate cytidylyltransferase [Melioribacter roseus P3M-2]|uniref:Phosphatidate cytidylyltransferase n=1 Tax=Melioribacter roseus (strain DSM 23840 / JCM 17771 / VKM B-2668 / P3M-2) TaxID=1191523 RepID=I7A4Q0_MELRP|nr:phosphatidate cytidylyltransferase [Melioribacter roseus]AFN74866.1 phosphatidate cytidylyltransferase [Melioribacter roseus P3M-2]